MRRRGSCEHIFGRRCIERQVRAGQPWSHICPLCREEWFPAPITRRIEAIEQLEVAMDTLLRVERHDAEIRSELEAVERALGVIRDMMYSHRWF